mmetsp:Transcript_1026/g.2817  ORF Transcript_1026/g.2817 Transcript_1026/m.2817 type:complete len:329 (-) Transcript_1026:635-1621(-)
MSHKQRLYEEFEQVAEYLHGRGCVSIEDVELMHPRAVIGLLAVVLLQSVLRLEDPRKCTALTICDDQMELNAVPSDFADVQDRFLDLRDRVRLLGELTEEETEWLKLRLLDPSAQPDRPARSDRERWGCLCEVFQQLYGTAVELSRLPAFQAHLELLAADLPLLAALRGGRQDEAAARLLEARSLPIAARTGQLRVVHRIMHLRGDWGEWLLYAAYSGHPCEVALALRRGAGVDTRSACGATPLIMAAMGGHAEVARLLLDWGADPALTTQRGLTAHAAAALAERGALDTRRRRRYAEVAAVLSPTPLLTLKVCLRHVPGGLSAQCPA